MVLNLPLDECIDNTTNSNTREKKKKRNELKETPTNDRKPNKGKEQDHLKKTSLRSLRQGQRLDTYEIKLCSNKERKPPHQRSKTTRAPPAHMQAPQNQCNSPWTNAREPPHETEQLHKHISHRLIRWTRSPSTWELHRSDRCPSPVRPMLPGKLLELKNSSKPLGNLLNACSKPFQAQTSPPC
jgi:hypothetical protein